MTEVQLKQYLRKNYPFENESCEWKDFESLKHSFSGSAGNDIISYISALSNMEGGHLVIGIEDGSHNVMGIQDFNNHTAQSIKLRLVNKCSNIDSDNFYIEEFITSDSNKTVWVFHIPKHLTRQPVYAHSKAWQRIEDSLVEIRKERMDAILKEEIKSNEDWSAQIIDDASLDDLDENAIQQAKENYKVKYPKLVKEVDEWSTKTFLNKAKLTINGEITNAAIILLGKSESEHYISPSTATISWILKDKDNIELDWEHFHPPLLLSVDSVFSKIRNLKYRYFSSDSSLFPNEIMKYDAFVIREALNNCIAHQDYTLGGKILLVELANRLVFKNGGSFVPENIAEVINRDAPDTFGRNRFLTQAMFNLNMIDTIGSGIKRMFRIQKERFFPLPEYSMKDNAVSVQIYGEVLNKNYTQYLAEHPDLSLSEAIIIDKEQKGNELNEKERKFIDKLNIQFNDQVDDQVDDQVNDQVNDQVISILKFCLEPKSRQEILSFIGVSNQTKNYKNHISPLLDEKLIEYTIKENIKDRNQKYKTSDIGSGFLN